MPKNRDLDFEEAVQDSFAGENDYLELPLSRQVFLLSAALIAITFIAVLGRLSYLVFIRGEFYQVRAESNVHREIILPALRGVITDRYGEVLVKNSSSFSVFLNLPELFRSGRFFDEALEKLASAVDFDREEAMAAVQKADIEKQNQVVLIRNLKPEEVIAVESLNFPGINIADDYIRQYIDGPAFAHILGYNSTVKVGLESFYDNHLRGRDGLSLVFEDAHGEDLDKKNVSVPVAGNELKTTIDAGLQRFFYHRLSNTIADLGASAGVGLAVDPRNGEILALVNVPSFDNNLFVSSGNSKERSRLLNSSSKPLFNRAVSGTYNPGSTIKPLVALAALREGLILPETEIFSRGWIEIPNPYNPDEPSRFVDWKPHGWVDVRSALARSSNVYFYAIGGGLPRNEFALLRGIGYTGGLGIVKLHEYWSKFLLDQKLGIDLGAESSGFLPDPEEKERRTGQIWRIGDTYNVSIGQGDLVITPLELTSFIASIANGGRIYQPHIVPTESPKVLLDYSDWREELEVVREGMEDAVRKSYGTASMLSALPMTSAGKTGSAQVENNRKTNAFFVGYANAENPEIAILVLVENAKEGSLNAVPIAHDVLEWYYYNRVAKTF